MCKVLRINRSGYYAWLKNPLSERKIEDDRLHGLIKHYWEEADKVYGSPRIFADLREAGETCGVNRVARIMKENGIKAETGYKKKAGKYGKPDITHPNTLNQEFAIALPDLVWTTDITQFRTWEGTLYSAVIMDLCSKRIIGWCNRSNIKRDIVLDALAMAVMNRRPENQVLIHSDQGSQYGSSDWDKFCKNNNLKISMSRRGNCYDNACQESFFASLKKERTRNRVYQTRREAEADIFDYIECFYNRKRRHSSIGMMSPVAYEEQLKRK
jgi:putative transposase